jgi:hypothetical protein
MEIKREVTTVTTLVLTEAEVAWLRAWLQVSLPNEAPSDMVQRGAFFAALTPPKVGA